MSAIDLAASRLLRNALGLLAFACVPLTAFAHGVALPPPIDKLIEKSELIVVARLSAPKSEEWAHIGSPDGNWSAVPNASVDASIIREIKGHCAKSITVNYFVSPFLEPGVHHGETEILFLRRSGGWYVPADKSLVAAPAVEEPEALKQANSTDVQVVMEELGRVVASPNETNLRKTGVLMGTMFAPPDKTFDRLLKAGFDEADPRLRSRIMLTLVERGDISTLDEAQEMLLHFDDRWPIGREALATAVGRLSNPGALPGLKVLMQSTDPILRRAVVNGMRISATAWKIPLFIDALDDSDREVACFASSALVNIAGMEQWACGCYEIQENRSKCVEPWRNWAAQKGLKK